MSIKISSGDVVIFTPGSSLFNSDIIQGECLKSTIPNHLDPAAGGSGNLSHGMVSGVDP